MTRFSRVFTTLCGAALVLTGILVIVGCQTTTRSGMPGHIRTIEVEIFKNNTMYKGLEGRLTRSIIDSINADPVIKVVSGGGDAVITGEITGVKRQTVRETTTDEPATVSLTVYATFSFYDLVEQKYIMEDIEVVSSDSSAAAGLYEASRGESVALAEESAMIALARDIVRRTVGMW